MSSNTDVICVKPKKGRKPKRLEKVEFRVSNGSVRQIPDRWDECDTDNSAEENPPSLMYVDERALSRSEKKVDYYTSMQSMLSSEIKEARSKVDKPKSTKKSRWNKKHSTLIQDDKNELLSWVENGVVSRSTAPKITTSITDFDDFDEISERPAISKGTLTLGDFVTSKPIKPKSRKNETVNVISIRDETNVDGSNPVTDMTKNEVSSDEGTCVNDVTNDENLNEKMESEISTEPEKKRISLCIHGIKFQVNSFTQNIHSLAVIMLDDMPFDKINAFSEALKILNQAVMSLRYEFGEGIYPDCKEDDCTWNTLISAKGESDIRYSNYVSPEHCQVIEFRVKLLTMNDPSYIPKSRDYSVVEMGEVLSFFINAIYREAFILLESVNKDRVNFLRREIKKFIVTSREWQEKDETPVSANECGPACCHWHRKREEAETLLNVMGSVIKLNRLTGKTSRLIGDTVQELKRDRDPNFESILKGQSMNSVRMALVYAKAEAMVELARTKRNQQPADILEKEAEVKDKFNHV